MLVIKLCLVSFFALNIIGCIVNPTPNSGTYTMTDTEVKAVQYNALQTQNADREARKAMLRDEAEIRAWEKNISSPNAVIVAPSRY